MSEKQENLKRLFGSDGRAVIVPIDHGTAIPVPGLESPAALIAALAPYADGFVVNYGLAVAASKALRGKGVCLRTDIYKPAPAGNPDLGSYPVYDTCDARSLGAHAVMNMHYPHHPNEAALARDCSRLISQSRDTAVPVIVETLPFGLGRPDDYTPEHIGFAVRQAAELGADVVKTAYPGDKEAFRDIVAASYVPVVVLGGALAGDDAALVRMVEDAIDAGASGVAIGRNVWQRKDPAAIAKAIAAVVHG